VLCLFAASSLLADSITGVSPARIRFGSVEEFLTIRGSGLAGSESTVVLFDGDTTAEPNNVGATEVVVWIPAHILYIEGEHSVEVIATDVGGAIRRIGPASFTVYSDSGGGDEGPPYLQLPEIVVAEATSASGAVVHFEVVGTSRNGNPAAVSCTPASGSSFPLGVTVVSCTASDPFGSTSESFLVFVGDTTPPAITVPADFTSATPVVTFSASAADNLDGPLPVTCSPASGSTFRSGVTTVVCRATDAHANVAYGSFRVTVTDGAPVITVPDDINAEATSSAGAAVSFVVTATGSGVTIACTPASGSTFAIGTTAVTCTATNASGSDSGAFNVIVYDGPPTLTVPADIAAEATSPAGAAVTFSATATDAVDGSLTPACTPASGSTFPLGTTTVDCSVTDSAGFTASDSFDVTVADTTPPQFVLLQASPGVLWPPDHKMVDVTLTAVVYDLVDAAPVTQIVAVTSDQPINGTGDGDTAPDWEITGPLTLKLRAERAGGNDRTYTITVQSTDDAGNFSRQTVQVKVSQGRRRR
jgi:hypothetical protein